MVGYLVPEEGRGRLRLEQVQVRGMPLLRACVPLGWNGERRLLRAARRLREAGVRRVLTPPDFVGWDLLERWGLAPVEPAPLCRALTAPLLLALLARRGVEPARATVLLRGERVDRVLFEAAQVLCPQVRTLAVSAPDGGAALCRLLREEYGAAVPETARSLCPDAAAELAPGERPVPGALHLYGPAPGLAGLGLRAPGAGLPGTEPLALLTLLWEAGRLSLREIEIFTIDRDKLA